ncbi:MAG: hypothetical protein D6820_12545 [Lentisphaerae bacterium]|nr:MAG: hypothetical protein D6820_12545 [Lentisphaerota bacterium]
MSKRAIVLGLLTSICIGLLTYINNSVMRQTMLIGNYLPVAVYGGLLIFLVVNTIVHRYSPRFALSSREIAGALLMILVSCAIPGSGLLRTFPSLTALPHFYNKTEPGWQKERLIDEVFPEKMLLKIRSDVVQGKIRFLHGDRVRIEPFPKSLLQESDQLKIHLYSDRTHHAIVRRVVRINRDTKELILDHEIAEQIPQGTPCRITRSDEERVLTPYIRGQGQSSQVTVPWDAWWPTFRFWLPLIIAFLLIQFGMGFMVHKQWAEHEQLAYPLASFTRLLLDDGTTKGSSMFSKRSFLIGAGVVFTIHVYNFLHHLMPDYLVAFPLVFDISPLVEHLPLRGPTYQIGSIHIYFTAIAIAYFLASDVALALGLSRIAYCFFLWLLSQLCINLYQGEGAIWTQPSRQLSAGAYVGAFLMLLYTGRHYYWNLLRRAFGLKSREEIPDYAIHGSRLALVAALFFCGWLCWQTGLPLVVAAFYLLMMILMYTVISRIVAETGLFFIQTAFLPGCFVIAILGNQALSPEMIAVLTLTTSMFSTYPRESLMPFLVNSLKLVADQKHHLVRSGSWALITMLVVLAITLPWTVYHQYRFGINFTDHANKRLPKLAPDATLYVLNKQKSQGSLQESRELSIRQRLTKIKPAYRPAFLAMLSGLVLFTAVAILRLHFPGWPIHPVIFLVWVPWAPGNFAWSFLIGWLIKVLVIRFGGMKTCHNLQPLMLGLVAGELLGALLPIIVGCLYFIQTGQPLAPYQIFPY